MPVSITSKTSDSDNLLADLKPALSAQGQGYVAALLAAGATMQIAPKWLQVKSADDVTLSAVHLNTTVVPLLLKDQLGDASKTVVVTKIEEGLSEACQTAKLVVAGPGIAADPPAPTKKPTKKAAAEPNKHVPLDYAQDLSVTPVQLRLATKLHQPVLGTSAGKVYFVVALSPRLNLAAHLQLQTAGSWSLSVRVEGNGLTEHKDPLTRVGFQLKGEYGSLHLSGNGGRSNLLKAVGALALALDLPMTVATGNSRLINKGLKA